MSGGEGRPSPFRWLDTLEFSRFHLLLLSLTVLAAISAGYNAQVVSYVLSFLLKEWRLTPVVAGTLVAYVFLGLMAGAVGFGIASDRWGRKWPFIIAVGLQSVFSGAVYFAPNFHIFCLFRFLAGVGIGGILPLGVALLSEFSPVSHRAKLLTVLGGGYTLGWALAGLTATWLIPISGWRSVLLAGVVPLLLIPFLQRYLPESVRFLAGKGRSEDALAEVEKIARTSRRPHPAWAAEDLSVPARETRGGFAQLFRAPHTVMTPLLWLTYLANMIAAYGITTWLPALFLNAGFSLTRSYGFGSMQAIGATFGGYLFGWAMDRYGRKRSLTTMYFLGGFSVLLLGLVSSPGSLYAAGIATGILVLGAPTSLHVVCTETYPTSIRSTGLGWAHAAGRIGSIAGPVLGGILQTEDGGITRFFIAFSIPVFVCTVLVLLYHVKARGEPLEAATEVLPLRGQGN